MMTNSTAVSEEYYKSRFYRVYIYFFIIAVNIFRNLFLIKNAINLEQTESPLIGHYAVDLLSWSQSEKNSQTIS